MAQNNCDHGEDVTAFHCLRPWRRADHHHAIASDIQQFVALFRCLCVELRQKRVQEIVISSPEIGRTCILSSPVASSITIVLICSSTSDRICAHKSIAVTVSASYFTPLTPNTHLVQVRVVCVQDTRELAVAAQLDVHALAERQLDEVKLSQTRKAWHVRLA